MKALSVRQPWAYSIFHLGKDIENRSWKRKFIIGERVAIHASANLTKSEYAAFDLFVVSTFGRELLTGLPGINELDRGAIIGTVKIKGVVSTNEVRKGLPVSDWFVGEFGYVMADPVLFEKPIPCKGALSLWEVPREILQQFPTEGSF